MANQSTQTSKPLPPVYALIKLAEDAVDGKPIDPLATFKNVVAYFVNLAGVPNVTKPK